MPVYHRAESVMLEVDKDIGTLFKNLSVPFFYPVVQLSGSVSVKGNSKVEPSQKGRQGKDHILYIAPRTNFR